MEEVCLSLNNGYLWSVLLLLARCGVHLPVVTRRGQIDHGKCPFPDDLNRRQRKSEAPRIGNPGGLAISLLFLEEFFGNIAL